MRTEVQKTEIDAKGNMRALVRRYVTDPDTGKEVFVGREWTRVYEPRENIAADQTAHAEVRALAGRVWTAEQIAASRAEYEARLAREEPEMVRTR
jgi:hypothetical protein